MAPPPDAAAARFVERYVAGWTLRGRPASSLAMEGVTEVVLFSLLPREDGGIDAVTNGLTDARIAAVKALAPRTFVAVGGERTGRLFRSPKLAESVAAFVRAHGLDGVVVDAEPLADVPEGVLVAFVRGLVAALAPRPVSAVVAPDEAEIARLRPVAGDLDRIAIMSYLGEPSAERERQLVGAVARLGIPRARIGVGIGPKTSAAVRRAREPLAGGVILWGDVAAR